ncbi:MAG: Asp23/Gls24 family envelope stress response protein [Firmicutes bacterium]|nr:Asp23/Gls24 family envelope stress response protein [Bacillota bacterium]
MSEEKKLDPEIVIEKGVPEEESDSVRIAAEVIGILAGIAASEVPGIAGMSGGLVGGIAEKLGRRDLAKGIRVHQEGNRVKLDANIIVEYGAKISEVAKKLRQAVREAVEETTGLNVVAINVHVLGIHLTKESEGAGEE